MQYQVQKRDSGKLVVTRYNSEKNLTEVLLDTDQWGSVGGIEYPDGEFTNEKSFNSHRQALTYVYNYL